MEFTEKTKLTDIMNAYPALTEALLKDDRISAIVSSPMGKLMLKTATIKDASRLSGESVESLIDELKRLTNQA